MRVHTKNFDAHILLICFNKSAIDFPTSYLMLQLITTLTDLRKGHTQITISSHTGLYYKSIS